MRSLLSDLLTHPGNVSPSSIRELVLALMEHPSIMGDGIIKARSHALQERAKLVGSAILLILPFAPDFILENPGVEDDGPSLFEETEEDEPDPPAAESVTPPPAPTGAESPKPLNAFQKRRHGRPADRFAVPAQSSS